MKIASDAPLPPSAAQAGPPVRTDKAQMTTFMIAATLRARPAACRRPAQGHLLAPHLDGPTTAACRPSLDCESQVPDNWKGFQMFRQQMQLQTICNWLY